MQLVLPICVLALLNSLLPNTMHGMPGAISGVGSVCLLGRFLGNNSELHPGTPPVDSSSAADAEGHRLDGDWGGGSRSEARGAGAGGGASG